MGHILIVLCTIGKVCQPSRLKSEGNLRKTYSYMRVRIVPSIIKLHIIYFIFLFSQITPQLLFLKF